MNSIYYDGTKYYKVGKHKDGSYVKFEVDNVGTYKCGGKVHKYGGHLDMNMDVSKMYQVGGKIELDMVKETGPTWNHYNKFASPMAQINYANGLQNQIAVPGVGVVTNDTDVPNFQEFTTNVPQYAVTEKLPRNSKFHFKNIETAEKLAGDYEREASKHVYDKDQTLRNDYLKKVEDINEYIEDQFKNRKQNGGLLKAQTGLIVPKNDPNQIYGGDLIFSGGPAYSNNKLTNIATMENPNQINPMLANSNDTLVQDNSPYGFKTNKSETINNPKSTGVNTTAPISSGVPTQSQFDPRKLTTYGDKIAEQALNRTTAYNLGRSLEPAYRNPLITPDFKFKQQYAQADFNPVYEMQQVGNANLANNARSTAALMGNMQQLNANMVKAKSDIARQAQLQQKGYDATFQGQQQNYQNQLAQARQSVEDKNKGDEAEKFNYLSDTMTNWEKADQGKAKLYNANLQNWNEMNTYVNSLSPEYQAVRDKDGVVKIVFKSSGQQVPAVELEKKKAEYDARQNKITTQYEQPTQFTKPSFQMNYQFGKKKLGGKLDQVTIGQNKTKKLRTGLY